MTMSARCECSKQATFLDTLDQFKLCRRGQKRGLRIAAQEPAESQAPHLLLRAPRDGAVARVHVAVQAAEDQLAQLVGHDALPVVDGVHVVEHHNAALRYCILHHTASTQKTRPTAMTR